MAGKWRVSESKSRLTSTTDLSSRDEVADDSTTGGEVVLETMTYATIAVREGTGPQIVQMAIGAISAIGVVIQVTSEETVTGHLVRQASER